MVHSLSWCKHCDPHDLLQAVVWTLVGILSLLIVASRKHYSVDVVIAW